MRWGPSSAAFVRRLSFESDIRTIPVSGSTESTKEGRLSCALELMGKHNWPLIFGTGSYSFGQVGCRSGHSRMTFHWPRGLVPTIAKQATNQAVRFPVQFYAKQFLTGGDKSLETNPIYNGNLDYGHGYTMTLFF